MKYSCLVATQVWSFLSYTGVYQHRVPYIVIIPYFSPYDDKSQKFCLAYGPNVNYVNHSPLYPYNIIQSTLDVSNTVISKSFLLKRN